MASSNLKHSKGLVFLRILASFIPLILTIFLLVWGMFFIRAAQTSKTPPPQSITVAIALIWGVGGIVLLFFTGDIVIEQLPAKWAQYLEPALFIGPALLMLTWALIVPTIRTLIASFYDQISKNFVGWQNYIYVFTNPNMRGVFRNNLLWLVFGTAFTVIAGLLIAVLADRSKFENAAKSMIFLPMAISFVGAGVIWNFVYAVRPVDAPQIGLLNAIFVGFFHGQPTAWTAFYEPWNNFYLIVVEIWLQTGFAMVLFSAAIKGIPAEILEAARVDGANEIQIFFRIMLPSIAGTIITVSTTIVIFTLKIFDVVWVMTGGQFGTSVIGTEFYRQYFTYNQNGVGSAIAVVLFITVIPVMVYNLRQFARREAL
ncbi:MAG: sugar ABC transporter permease [Anaerolineales bacterium]